MRKIELYQALAGLGVNDEIKFYHEEDGYYQNVVGFDHEDSKSAMTILLEREDDN